MAKKESKKQSSFLLPLFIIVGIFLAIFFGWQNGWFGKSSDLTENDFAQTLLTKEEVETATKMEGKIAPDVVDFNQSLDPESDAKYGNIHFVSRIHYDKSTGKVAVENVLLGFNSKEAAENFINLKAQEAGNAKITYSFDGTVPTLTLVSANTPETQGSVNLRFAIGNLVSRIQVYAHAETEKTAEVLLTPIVMDLATRQKEKMESLMAGTLRAPTEPQNNSMARLPKTISGATNIGSFPVTMDEWLGTTEDFQKDTLPGYVSGSQAVFSLDGKPKQAADMYILEFATEQDARAYLDTFFKEGVHVTDETSKELALPDSLKTAGAVARTSEKVDELQVVVGVYLIGVGTYSPYGDFDQEVGTQDLIRISEEVLNGFTP